MKRFLTFILIVLLLGGLGGWFFAGATIPAPEGVSERYVLHVSRSEMAAVEDTQTGDIVLWYDFDAGPDLENIEKLPSGEWVVTLVPRDHQ